MEGSAPQAAPDSPQLGGPPPARMGAGGGDAVQALFAPTLSAEHMISRYEYARLIGARVVELYRNCPSCASVASTGSGGASPPLTHAQSLAQREFDERALPLLLVRRRPGGTAETRESHELQLIARPLPTSTDAPRLLGGPADADAPQRPPPSAAGLGEPGNERPESTSGEEEPPHKMARKSTRRALADEDLCVAGRVRAKPHIKGRRLVCAAPAPGHP